MPIRISAMNAPRFSHGGIAVSQRWIAVDPDDKARATLREYAGRFIRVHPEDLDKLAEYGLRAERGENGRLTGKLLALEERKPARAAPASATPPAVAPAAPERAERPKRQTTDREPVTTVASQPPNFVAPKADKTKE